MSRTNGFLVVEICFGCRVPAEADYDKVRELFWDHGGGGVEVIRKDGGKEDDYNEVYYAVARHSKRLVAEQNDCSSTHIEPLESFRDIGKEDEYRQSIAKFIVDNKLADRWDSKWFFYWRWDDE